MKRKLCFAIAGLLALLPAPLMAQKIDAAHLHLGAHGRWNRPQDTHGLYRDLLNAYNYGSAGLTLGLQTLPEDENWFSRAFNYPTYGVGVQYNGMGGLPHKGVSRLGDIWDAYAWARFDFLKISRFRLGPQINLGLAYSPTIYNWKDNPANKFIGAHFFALVGAGVRAEWLFAPHWSLELVLDMIHHSNGMVQAPNLGIDELSAGVGLRYYLAPANFVSKKETPALEAPLYKKGFQARILAAAGVHSCPVELNGKLDTDRMDTPLKAHPQVVLCGEFLWRYSPIFASGVLVEGSYTGNHYRETDLALEGREDPAGYSPFRAGIAIMQDFWYRQVSLHAALGVYVFKKTGLTEDIGPFFQKVGLRYHFMRADGLFASMELRAHYLDRSYSIDWGLGYRF